MPRQYDNPAAFKQALEQRLRNETEGSGEEMARRRQLLVMDRFVSRAAQIFGDAMVLKGGLVLELRLERARTTKDIDLRLAGSPGAVLQQLQRAGRLDLDEFLSYEVRPDPRHPDIDAEGLRYQGQRFRAEARLGGKPIGSPFGVDVAFAEPLHGAPELFTGSRLLEFAGVAPGSFLIYPMETHIAEKLHAYTLPRKRPNSRVKDLPDIALLASIREIDAAGLRNAIDQTFASRATHAVPKVLPEPPPAWAPVYERMAREDGLAWPTLESLYATVRAFLDPVLGGESGHWSHDAQCWR